MKAVAKAKNSLQLKALDKIIERTKKLAEQAKLDRLNGVKSGLIDDVGESQSKLRTDADGRGQSG